MFYNFKNVSLKLNNNNFIVNDIQLSNEIQLQPRYVINNRISETVLPNSMWIGSLKINYYLTGLDYLKQYIYSNELETITGNIGGLSFNQGYLSNYSLNIQPNSPLIVNATISFFDQLTGNFITTNPINSTGTVLRSSDLTINNLSSYTQNILNSIVSANLNYSCNLKPSYQYFDTGILPTRADNVFMEEKSLSVEINSDNTNLNIPISGENFGAIFTFSNPYNTGIYETFGCSGKISSKSISFNTNNPHIHSIKIEQPNVNKNGYIYSVLTGLNQLTIVSNTGSSPFLSRDGSLSYVDNISIGDTNLTGYVISRNSDYDQIVCPIPLNITNDSLTVSTSYGNYIWPNKIHFSYPPITITGLSQYTGSAGTLIYISGTNFYRISDVLFGGNIQSQFQIINPQTIAATIPYNGITNPITISSNLRQISGSSQSGFFYQPLINSINPVTGQWKDTITISGNNFSGITGVYFNQTKAFSFSVISNNIITARTPDTGSIYCSGYISIYGTGGFGQSTQFYNPVIPIYGFSPQTGIPGTGIIINTKIDTGYLSPLSGGYKVKIGGIDTVFFSSGTGILSGILPFNSTTDFVYIYENDGNSTSSSQSQLSVIGFPSIYYVTPNVINQYGNNSLFIVGNNLNNFRNRPYYVSLSGGSDGNFQSFNTGTFVYSYVGHSIYLTGVNITGSTGYYDLTIQNTVSYATLTGGLLVLPAVNLANSLIPTVQGKFNTGPSYSGQPDNYPLSSATSPLYCIDYSDTTFTSISPSYRDISPIQNFLQLTPSSPIDIQYLQINPVISGLPPASKTYRYTFNISSFYIYAPIYSGSIVLFTGNSYYSGTFKDCSTGITFNFVPKITGVSSIKIINPVTASVLDIQNGKNISFLPIEGINIY